MAEPAKKKGSFRGVKSRGKSIVSRRTSRRSTRSAYSGPERSPQSMRSTSYDDSEPKQSAAQGQTTTKKTSPIVIIVIFVVLAACLVGAAILLSKNSGGGEAGDSSTTPSEPELSISLYDYCDIDREEIAYLGEYTGYTDYYKIRIKFCEYLPEGYSYEGSIERSIEDSTVTYEVDVEAWEDEDYLDYDSYYENEYTIEIEDGLEAGSYTFEVHLSGEVSGTYRMGQLTVGE